MSKNMKQKYQSVRGEVRGLTCCTLSILSIVILIPFDDSFEITVSTLFEITDSSKSQTVSTLFHFSMKSSQSFKANLADTECTKYTKRPIMVPLESGKLYKQSNSSSGNLPSNSHNSL
jgi:hypothetical protein